MRTVAIIQVRTTSTRLPNKCLLRICGCTVLEHVIERVRNAKTIDDICIATTTNREDDAVVALLKDKDVKVWRGSEEDVLDRFYQAARFMQAGAVCRITADDPLKDPAVVDAVVETYRQGGFDYVSNTMRPTYPEGIDVEVFSFQALERAWKEARLPSEHEHVTPYIWKNEQDFRTYNVTYGKDLSWMRWTLDKAADFVFIDQVYEELYHGNPQFSMEDVLCLLERKPWLLDINKGTVRNEGYLKSIKEEGQI